MPFLIVKVVYSYLLCYDKYCKIVLVKWIPTVVEHRWGEGEATYLNMFLFFLLGEKVSTHKFSSIFKNLLQEELDKSTWQLVIEELARKRMWQVSLLLCKGN